MISVSLSNTLALLWTRSLTPQDSVSGKDLRTRDLAEQSGCPGLHGGAGLPLRLLHPSTAKPSMESGRQT